MGEGFDFNFFPVSVVLKYYLLFPEISLNESSSIGLGPVILIVTITRTVMLYRRKHHYV